MNSVKQWLIGASKDCDIVIDRPAVSAKHCRLRLQDGAFVLEDLDSTNGTFVNGQRVHGSVAVRPSDSITLGRTTPLPFPSDAPRITRIGRADDNDIVLNSASVSAYHAELIEQSGAYRLRDLGSLNGVAVGAPDGKVQETTLTPDDVVYFGELRMLASDLIGGVSEKTVLAGTPPVLADSGDDAAPLKSPKSDAPASATRNAKWLAVAGVGIGLVLFLVLSTVIPAIQRPPQIQPEHPTVPTASHPIRLAPGNADQNSDGKAMASDAPPHQAVYTVMVRNADGSVVFQVGTAWAVRPEIMITSGAVAGAVKDLAEEFPYAFVTSAEDPRRLVIKSSMVHEEYLNAWRDEQAARKDYETLKQQAKDPGEDALPPEKLKKQILDAYERLIASMERETCFDVGLLKLSEHASHVLKLAPPTRNMRVRKVTLLARPFPQEDPLFEAPTPPQATPLPCLVRQYASLGLPEERHLVVAFARESLVDQCLFGAPLATSDGKVIGVFSRSTPPYAQPERALATPTFDVSLNERIQELLDSFGDGS